MSFGGVLEGPCLCIADRDGRGLLEAGVMEPRYGRSEIDGAGNPCS